VIAALAEADAFERLLSALVEVFTADHGRDHYVLDRCELGEKVVVLENVGELGIAELCLLAAAQGVNVDAVEKDIPLLGGFKASQCIHECGLARTGWATEEDALTALHREIDPVEDFDTLFPDGVSAVEVVGFD